MSKENPDAPKSIRLNAGHRHAILTSVMDQWDAKNPAPKTEGYIGFITALLSNYKEATKRTPQTLRPIGRMFTAASEISEMLENLSPAVRERTTFRTKYSFNLALLGEDGQTRNTFSIGIPLAVAKAVGYPVFEIGGTHVQYNSPMSASSELPRWSKNDNCIETASILGSEEITVGLPENSPEWQAFCADRELHEAHNKTRSQMFSEVSDYLDQFTTTGQIRDQWPELEPFLPAAIADPAKAIKLPALTKSRLNERLGL